VKIRLGPTQNLYPMPCCIVVGGTIDDPGALTVAWINIVSSTPPTVAVGIRGTRHTLERIRATSDFTVNVPSTALAPQVDVFGIVSGRAADKFAATGLTLSPSAVVTSPLVDQCAYNLECRVTQEVPVGEYVLLLGEVVESHAEESVLDASGTKCDIGALDPLVYIAGSREYHGVGPKTADAYTVGRPLLGEK
jgi:flavin reductase (DIM6/NTAB) family NADH-FMN oxidoreductase RutF